MGCVEQAELRRQLSGERKRTSKLEAAQTKLQSLYENRLVDLKALRTALSNREDQLKVPNTEISVAMLCWARTLHLMHCVAGCLSTSKGAR